MPLFACTKCRCVENTALSGYWSRTPEQRERGEALCSECDPVIGQWHGRFEKKSAIGWLIDQSGHLWREGEVLPPNYRIVGKVEA